MPEFIYRFSIGNATTGQVGLCFDLKLEQDEEDQEEAVQEAREALDHALDDPLPVLASRGGPAEDLVVFVNADKITVDDIVDVTEVTNAEPT